MTPNSCLQIDILTYALYPCRIMEIPRADDLSNHVPFLPTRKMLDFECLHDIKQLLSNLSDLPQRLGMHEVLLRILCRVIISLPLIERIQECQMV